MTRATIANILSERKDTDFKIIHVKCRPPEKSDRVLTTIINGHTWYAERPTYYWSAFDRSFVSKPYINEEQLLYPGIKEPLGLFDAKGRWWVREEMSSFGLVKHFLRFPTLYLSIMATHTNNVKEIVRVLKKIKPTLSKPRYFKKNLQTFLELYQRMYEAHAAIFTIFDELVWQFRGLLLKHLPKETVNTYFPKFLSGEATKEALKKGYTEERGTLEYETTRGVLYAMNLRPRTFYVPPHYFPDFLEDPNIIAMLLEHGTSQTDMQNFFAFRSIVPLGFQINEEAQYTETSGLSAHLGILMRAVSKKLKTPLEKLQNMTVTKIAKKLQKQQY